MQINCDLLKRGDLRDLEEGPKRGAFNGAISFTLRSLLIKLGGGEKHLSQLNVQGWWLLTVT